MFNSKVIEQFQEFNATNKPFTVWALVTASGQAWSGGSDGAAQQVVRMIQQGYGPAAGCLTMVVTPPAEIAKTVKATRYHKWPEDTGALLAIFNQGYINAAYASFLGGSDDGDENFAGYLHDRLVSDLWPSKAAVTPPASAPISSKNAHVAPTVAPGVVEKPAPAQPVDVPVPAFINGGTSQPNPETPEAVEKETIVTFTSVAAAVTWIVDENRKMGDDQRFTVNARNGVYSGHLSDFRVDAAISKAAVEKALKAKLA